MAELITQQEAAEILGITQRRIRNWRKRGIGCKYVRMRANCVRYERSVVEHFKAHGVYPCRGRLTPRDA